MSKKNMNFFNSDYEIPNESNYMKLEEGDNRFRILGTFADGECIMGTEYWKTMEAGTRKPIRLPLGKNVPMQELEVNPQSGELEKPKHFWALPVWNYDAKKVQILEITQKTIQQYIKKLADNPKWGDPREYDIVVTRIKEGGKTSYTITADPKEVLTEEISLAYKDTHINLQAMFAGEDPFTYQGDGGQLVEDAANALG